jgi:hypothetical protein
MTLRAAVRNSNLICSSWKLLISGYFCVGLRGEMGSVIIRPGDAAVDLELAHGLSVTDVMSCSLELQASLPLTPAFAYN